MKKRMNTGDYKEISNVAEAHCGGFIATYGMVKARLIAKAIFEKVEANYKALKTKYPNEY